MELFGASAVIRRFWNLPRGAFPPEESGSLLLRSENDSKAAAIGPAPRLSELPLAVVAALPLAEPRSRESIRDWALSHPGSKVPSPESILSIEAQRAGARRQPQAAAPTIAAPVRWRPLSNRSRIAGAASRTPPAGMHRAEGSRICELRQMPQTIPS